MSGAIELDLYIPPDVALDDNGDYDITDNNKVYHFNNDVDKFTLSFTGLGMPQIEYITQQGPYQHGQTTLDYRLRPRQIQYVHRRNAKCSRSAYWDIRSDIINILRPNRQTCNTFESGRLRKILPDGTRRDIEAKIALGPVFAARDPNRWDEWSITEPLRFECDDPTFFDPELQTAIWELTNLENLIFYGAALAVPTPVPDSPGAPDWSDRLVFEGDNLDAGGIWFGEDSLYQTLDVTYGGTWLSYPTIKMIGPINQPQVLNLTTNEKIELAYNISSGEEVTINLEFGNKTVINNSGTNLIGTVTTDSNLGTWHLAPDPEAPDGVNQLQVIGDEAVIGETQVRIEWFTRYIGI